MKYIVYKFDVHKFKWLVPSNLKSKTNLKKNQMENWKSIAVQLLVVTAGVLVALKVKEQMDKAKVSKPSTK